MKQLIFILSIFLFTVSCKKEKTKPLEAENAKEVLKKPRFEINVIKGDYKKIYFSMIYVGGLHKEKAIFDEPIFIKPANLKFTTTDGKGYSYTSIEGKETDSYIIESKNPIVACSFSLIIIMEHTETEESIKIETKVFIDNKPIKTYQHELSSSKTGALLDLAFNMNDY